MGLQEMNPQEASRAWGSWNPAHPGHLRPSVEQVLWACGEQMEGELWSQGDPGSHLFSMGSLCNPTWVVHFSVLPQFPRL